MPKKVSAAHCHTAAIALTVLMAVSPASAQSASGLGDYYSHGAQATTIPQPGQPGYEYFSRGSQLWSVPAPGQPGAELFNQGSQATSVPQPGQPGYEYFSHGAQDTSVPATGQPGAEYFQNGSQATALPARGQPGYEYFQNGSQATALPGPGQPGYEYFAQGSAATSVYPPRNPPPAAAPAEPAAVAVQEPAEQAAQAVEPAAQEPSPEAEAPAREPEPAPAPPAATSGEPLQDETWSAPGGPANTETSVTPARSRALQRVAAPLPEPLQDASQSMAQGHYAAALDRLLEAYAVLFVIGGVSLGLCLATLLTLGLRAKRRRLTAGPRHPARAR